MPSFALSPTGPPPGNQPPGCRSARSWGTEDAVAAGAERTPRPAVCYLTCCGKVGDFRSAGQGQAPSGASTQALQLPPHQPLHHRRQVAVEPLLEQRPNLVTHQVLQRRAVALRWSIRVGSGKEAERAEAPSAPRSECAASVGRAIPQVREGAPGGPARQSEAIDGCVKVATGSGNSWSVKQ